MTAAGRIDALLPVRNGDATLDACLKGLLAQRGVDLRVVAVDDGSTDRTPAILEACAQRDPRLVVVSGPGQGLVPALHAGLAHCNATWVARVDADDVCHRNRLRCQLAHAKAHQLDGVGCHVHGFGGLAGSDNMRRYLAWLRSIRTPSEVARDQWIECPVPHPTWLVRRRVLEAIGYRHAVPNGRRIPEDYDLLLRSLESGHRWGVVPRRLVAWRLHAESHSRTDSAYSTEAFVQLKAAHLAETFLKASQHYVLWGHGPTGRSLRSALSTYGRNPSHIVEVHRGRIGRVLQGAEVIPPEGMDDIPRGPLLAAVSGSVPRAQIRAFLNNRAWVEGQDYLCTA